MLLTSWRAMLMQHERADAFSRSCWQRSHSTYSKALLIWRSLTLMWALSVFSWSLASFWGPYEIWPIYMTHWGITFLLLHSIFATLTTFAGKLDWLPDATFGLPWYVQTYWVLFNIAIPIALLITVFYWSLLYTSNAISDYAPNMLLDVSLHALNSVIMMIELFASGHPSRLLHVYQPAGVGLIYVLFTVFYYLAGGVDAWGHHYIYPPIDWSRPGPTTGVVAVTAFFLILMHLLVVALSKGRDKMAAKLRAKRDPSGLYNDAYIAA